jgi:hypothetical protein
MSGRGEPFTGFFYGCSSMRARSFSPFCKGHLAVPVRLTWLHACSSVLRSSVYPDRKCKVRRPWFKAAGSRRVRDDTQPLSALAVRCESFRIRAPITALGASPVLLKRSANEEPGT